MRIRQRIIVCIAVVWGLGTITGCTATRYLAEDEKFYTGYDIDIESEEHIPQRSRIRSELEEVVRPDPTPSFLGIARPRVWVYYAMGSPERGVRAWIQNRIGRPPVLFDRVTPEHTAMLMENRLHNNGYFNASVSYELKERRHTGAVNYRVQMDRAYRIRTILFPDPDDELTRAIAETRDESLVHAGDIFNLSTLREERERIDDELKENGFFYFNADFLKFFADTSAEAYAVDLYLTVKPEIPARAMRPYRINDVIVYPDYTLQRGRPSTGSADTLTYGDITFVSRANRIRPGVIARSVFIRPGELYRREDRVTTVNRLMGLGTFRFANVRFTDIGDDLLDARVHLTPADERSVRVELQAVSKSNDFAGPGLNLNYRNRNFRRGAEQLTLSATSGFETQLGGRQRGLDSYEVGIDAELLIPRIISPVGFARAQSMFVPRTRYKLGYQLLNRVQLFRLNSFNAAYGFIWNTSPRTRHQLDPLSVNYVRTAGLSEEFERRLDLNPTLRRSFEQQFIVGPSYSFFYNTQMDEDRRNHLYLNANVDFSGNILYLLHVAVRERTASADDPYKLFGVAFSQYSRIDMDIRYFYWLGGDSRLVTRFIGGVAVPYGNSDAVPYVKQFFIGGTNSVRAFPARSIGPGSYRPADEQADFFLDRTGDLRLEANIEYRFPLVSILRGAFFIDAGNIWMVRDDPERPGTVFDFDTFLSQVAVGTGFGLRLDISFFVLRLDIAFPLRRPYLPAGERWVIDDIRFGSGQWRSDNLTFNLAIGYPF
jgi:outer membrane protein insertion porin family